MKEETSKWIDSWLNTMKVIVSKKNMSWINPRKVLFDPEQNTYIIEWINQGKRIIFFIERRVGKKSFEYDKIEGGLIISGTIGPQNSDEIGTLWNWFQESKELPN